MPELPEVETIKRGLREKLLGRIISNVQILTPKTFIGESKLITNSPVVGVDRRAKVLKVNFKNGNVLLFHLKMTGQLIWNTKDQSLDPKTKTTFAGGHPSHDWHAVLPNKSTRVVFTFDDDSQLFFNDQRKFGWCRVVSEEQANDLFAKKFGPEPLSAEFTVKYLQGIAKRYPRRKIKQILTDQQLIAGIGNIYADESLYKAGISPLRLAHDLSEPELRALHESIAEILRLAIEKRGTTDSDYVDAEGNKGGMQNYLKVYRKAGELCPRECGGEIKRIVIGGRGTHYCPTCQR